jgi:hypothetical protein
MDNGRFDQFLGNYTAAIRRGDATAAVDQTALRLAEATKSRIVQELAAHCHPEGLHLLAVDKVYSPGASFRWASPVAERLAAEINREGSGNAVVTGLGADSTSIELALRVVSHAVGAAAAKHPGNWVSGVLPNEIWLDS